MYFYFFNNFHTSNLLIYYRYIIYLYVLIIYFRYQLLLVLSKEIVAKWQIVSDDHNNFNYKLTEFKSWLESLENKPTDILNNDNFDLNAKLTELQSIFGNSEQSTSKLLTLTSFGESLYPDTSTVGRETIRQQLKEVRERYFERIYIKLHILFYYI